MRLQFCSVPALGIKAAFSGFLFAVLLYAQLPGLAQPLGLGSQPNAAEPQAPLQRVRPQPNLRHAGLRYRQSFATVQDIVPVVDSLESAVPEAVKKMVGKETTLRELHHALAESLPVAVQFDLRALHEEGLDEDVPVVLDVESTGASLNAALTAILTPHDLGFTAVNGSLCLTTNEGSGYCFAAHYPFPTSIDDGRDIERLVQTIQSTIASDTWDSVGGDGSIQVVPEANEFVISTTLRIHLLIGSLFRTGLDSDLEPTVGKEDMIAGQMPMRSYAISSPEDADALVAWVSDTTNKALGALADPQAQVTVFGGRLIVQSCSRPFHVYAAELMRSVNGIEWPQQGF